MGVVQPSVHGRTPDREKKTKKRAHAWNGKGIVAAEACEDHAMPKREV